jgi:hypothetical protein
MKPNNMSDEELDQLFKKSVDSYNPPFDPEAWDAMEKKLDNLEGWNQWWRKYLYPLLILLVPGIVLLVTRAQAPDSTTETVKPAASQEMPIKENQHIIQMALQPIKALSASKKTIAVAGHHGNGEPLTERTRKQTDAKTTPGPGYRQAENRQAAGLTQDALLLEDPPLASPKVQLASTSFYPVKLPARVAFQNRPGPRGDSGSNFRKPENRSAFLGSLQVSLAVAPDITTIKYTNPDAISMNTGMFLGIPVTHKISVITGILWANKVYGANAEEYAPTSDYWQGKKRPSSIEAECKVLDIPFDIRYKVLEGEKNVLAIQAGLSSYIMLDEKYTYHYTYSQNPYRKTTEFSNENTHWFRVQNLSLSYSRKLSPDISVGVEPFVKIPLSGIGAGNVKLTSAGVFLTAGYTIHLKK